MKFEDFFMESPKDWPPTARRIYVMGWPLFAPLRIVMFIILAIFVFVFVIFMKIASYFVTIWKGKKPDWDFID